MKGMEYGIPRRDPVATFWFDLPLLFVFCDGVQVCSDVTAD